MYDTNQSHYTDSCMTRLKSSDLFNQTQKWVETQKVDVFDRSDIDPTSSHRLEGDTKENSKRRCVTPVP